MTDAIAATADQPPAPSIDGALTWISRALFALFALSMPAYALARMFWTDAGPALTTAIVSASWFLCSVALCVRDVGVARGAALLASGFAIAFSMEYLGSSTGFLFGAYSYTDVLGPKALGYVPLIIPLAWFMMLYPSWRIAARLTANRWARVAIAALAMTAWDLSLDPRMVADRAWVWHQGGAYFGIPLSNFLGWLVTSALIFAVWALVNPGLRPSPGVSRLPEWVYVIAWLGESGANILFWNRPIIGVITFVAMGAFVVPALLRTHRIAAYNHRPRHG